MFQIFVCWTAFCVLSPVPLWGGTAHVGFQLKTLQYTLPCLIALRFCTFPPIIKYLGDNVGERHWFKAQIEHLSIFRVRDHSSCPAGANDGKVESEQSAFLSFSFLLPRIKFALSGEKEGDAGEECGGLRWGECRGRERGGWASMCLKYVSLQLYTPKRRWGVCLAATPKDCHKPINTTPAPTSPPTQMMSAFIRRVVIPPLAACEAAAVPLFASAPKAWKTASLRWLASHRTSTTHHKAEWALCSCAALRAHAHFKLSQRRGGAKH